jgi:antitoxin component of MazEF toxin-antitoxin module
MYTEQMRLEPSDRLALPAALCHSANLKPGDPVVVESDGYSLLIRPADLESPSE